MRGKPALSSVSILEGPAGRTGAIGRHAIIGCVIGQRGGIRVHTRC